MRAVHIILVVGVVLLNSACNQAAIYDSAPPSGRPEGHLTFRVIDADLGKPLENVNVERKSFVGRPGGSACEATNPQPVELVPSTANGIVEVSKLCTDEEHNFRFKLDGYIEANASWFGGKDIAINLAPFDAHHYERFQSTNAASIVEVRLYPVKYKPVWKQINDAPQTIVDIADMALRGRNGEHGQDDQEWRHQPGTMRAYRSQYGVYGICWFGPLSDRWYQSVGVIVNPPDEVVGFTGGSGSGNGDNSPANLEKNGW